ncbi:metalloendoproteinase 2-MMP-like [Rhododendron vialii]|uniref:metalloendoproteinase 2-MMP-like n=1 Tax=Rhododendron vialii TaxID=182163 RepID=UPI00265DDE4F|nr:metalloendoproteinase 2-MMP-like [Rhododendron vialii]
MGFKFTNPPSTRLATSFPLPKEMETKLFQLFLCIFLVSLPLPLPSHARPSKPKVENPTSFDFIKHLEGGHKGETVKGLQQLKKYLEAFGYLNYSLNQAHANDDNFDDSLEAAVKTYQLNYHLKTTGALDAQTVSQMTAPRCGVPDIVNGTNWMRGGKKEANHTHSTIHAVSHFTFFGDVKWPPTQYQLTYAFAPQTSSNAIFAVARAFNTWASQTQFRFSQSQNFTSADLKIGFYRGDHGDGAPFNGANGILAHAFAPTDGRFHYNGDYSFTVSPVRGSYHLETVALHEIGHLLGLGHSKVRDAIMWPSILDGTTKGLNADDIQGIRTLYT